ncbi:AMP-binding protein [Gordonia sp. HY285]|uniref:AMP-binding protein n=1 Tax=Gordonia liuliyuniae TaxID=2911517 RepID=UPI001F3E6B3A|nr:AMP-binding protein [Gordonia liuliyuniae]MCF8608922.1 AMP-binding protein [Gordonia liuliyuniae]
MTELNYATIWEAIADANPSREALVHGSTRRTWREFDDRAARIANALLDSGLKRGSKVAQLLYNCTEFAEVYFATIKIRAAPFSVNYRYVGAEIKYLLDNADAEALVYHASLRDRVVDLLPNVKSLKIAIEVDDSGHAVGSLVPHGVHAYNEVVSDFDPAERIVRDGSDVTISYTGGTTGMPKGVTIPMGPAIEELMGAVPLLFGDSPVTSVDELLRRASDVSAEEDRYTVIPASPVIHNAAVGMAMNPALLFGGKAVMLSSRSFDAAELWDVASAEKTRGIVIVGDAFARPMLKALDASDHRDLSSLAMIASTGAMFAAEVKGAILEHLPKVMIADVISATEGAMGAAISVKEAQMPTGSFLPYPGVIVISDEDHEVKPGSDEIGRIALPSGGQTYYRDEAKTAETFRVLNGRRYSIPGDYARVLKSGVIELLGRGSSCVNTAGEKVYPEEVEEVIKRFDGIEDCLVFGVADERLGQRLSAVYSVAPEVETIDLDALDEFLRSHLAGYKVPRVMKHVGVVPRVATGKADYPEAKRLYEASVGASPKP